jgi:hypothetical protein
MAYTDIDKPSDYFNTVLYTGNGSSQSITGVGFQPDWVWVKRRDSGSSHLTFDAIRGVYEYLIPDQTSVETTRTDSLTSFDSDGFSTGSISNLNASGSTYVGWNWLASNTTSSNTDGDIASTVSANTTSGFSIVTFTGNGTASGTVGHGLGVAPKIVLYKKLNGTSDWFFWTTQIDGSNDDLRLNTTDTKSDLSGTSGSITASTFSNYGWGVSDNMIAYCFAEKKGFSKFGSYTGNGSADGTFVYTGFRPAFVMVKETTDSGTNWRMLDNKRDPFNLVDNRLFPDLSNSESVGDGYDFLSNGFKLRTTNGDCNGSGNNYIYMCFAENPLVSSAGVPCTAR